MDIDNKNKKLSDNNISELAGFFDLLAKFDYEDKKRIKDETGLVQKNRKVINSFGEEITL